METVISAGWPSASSPVTSPFEQLVNPSVRTANAVIANLNFSFIVLLVRKLLIEKCITSLSFYLSYPNGFYLSAAVAAEGSIRALPVNMPFLVMN
jgi:hypothetical protein